MKRVLGSLFVVIAGFVAGGLVIGVVEWIGHFIWPPPEGIAKMDPDALRAAMAQVPPSAMAWIVLAWAVGSLAAGALSASFSGRTPLLHALCAGALLLAAGVAMLLSIPHPLWFRVAGLAVFLPCAAAGGFLGWRYGAPRVGSVVRRLRSAPGASPGS